MSDHRPQPRSSTTHDFNHPYVRPSQYDMLERNTCPPPPPPRIKQPERRTRIYHEQHISHHIPAVRQHYAYKPALSGKAAEVLGVDDVREFEHNFSEKLEKKKKKAKTWRTRKFRVTKNDAKKTKVKRTVPVERVQNLPRSDSAVEIPSMSHFSWSGDEDKIKKFRLHKKEMGVKEGKRSARCTIMPAVSRFSAVTHQLRRYSALEAISTVLISWTSRRQDYHELDEFDMDSEDGFGSAILEDVEESDNEL